MEGGKEDTLIIEDARVTRQGAYSAWLKKTKSDNARCKLIQSSNTRYFTIDFDSQIMFYSHSTSQKKVSQPIPFKNILGAERLPLPEKKSRRNTMNFGFVLKTPQRNFELFTNSSADAAQWTVSLNAAMEMGQRARELHQKCIEPYLKALHLEAAERNQAFVQEPEKAAPLVNAARKEAAPEAAPETAPEAAPEAAPKAAVEVAPPQEEAARKQQEEEAARQKQEEEEALRQKQEEAARRKQEKKAARLKQEEEAARKQEEEAARQKQEEEEALRQKQEEAARRKQEKKAARLKQEEEAARKQQEEEEEEAARQKQEEQAALRQKQEQDAEQQVSGGLESSLEDLSDIKAGVQDLLADAFAKGTLAEALALFMEESEAAGKDTEAPEAQEVQPEYPKVKSKKSEEERRARREKKRLQREQELKEQEERAALSTADETPKAEELPPLKAQARHKLAPLGGSAAPGSPKEEP